MLEAITGLAMVGALIGAILAVDLLLSRRERRRLAAGGAPAGVAGRRRRNRAANEGRAASQANGMSSTTYLG